MPRTRHKWKLTRKRLRSSTGLRSETGSTIQMECEQHVNEYIQLHRRTCKGSANFESVPLAGAMVFNESLLSAHYMCPGFTLPSCLVPDKCILFTLLFVAGYKTDNVTSRLLHFSLARLPVLRYSTLTHPHLVETLGSLEASLGEPAFLQQVPMDHAIHSNNNHYYSRT